MTPRPTWKGYLKLSLVSCSTAMYTATRRSRRIRLTAKKAKKTKRAA